jgi:hypothetical protein
MSASHFSIWPRDRMASKFGDVSLWCQVLWLSFTMSRILLMYRESHSRRKLSESLFSSLSWWTNLKILCPWHSWYLQSTCSDHLIANSIRCSLTIPWSNLNYINANLICLQQLWKYWSFHWVSVRWIKRVVVILKWTF